MPLPIVTVAQMRDWEKATWAAGQSEAEVIRRVGAEVARLVLSLTVPRDTILLVTGKGHNGDDARAAREHLSCRRVEELTVAEPAAALPQLQKALASGPSLVVDALFGIGLNRPLSPEWVRLIETLNAARLPVLSVDVPSGLDAQTGLPQGAAVQAAVTLTVGAPKAGLLLPPAWEYVGRLEVCADVGLVPCPGSGELNWTDPRDFNSFPPPRSAAGHKGTYGHVAIVAGSLGYHGAAVLAARGAQRAQPGLVTLYTQPAVYAPVAGQLQSVMVSPLEEQDALSGSYTALAVGPGLASPHIPDTLKDLVRDLWLHSPAPMLVDATALAWLTPGSTVQNAIRVLTPHPGEAARMLGTSAQEVQANRPAALRSLSERFGSAWVVLKGHQTLIGRNTGEIRVNSSGNPHLAQGGSGDLLSGYLGGLLAQPSLQAHPLLTLAYAVWQHGAAADLLQARQHNWTVEELATVLGSVGPGG